LGRKTALPVLFLAVTVAGCAVNMDIDVGKRPNLAAIEQRLRIGESTVDDVLAVLGPPRGKGKAMLPIDPKRRITWSYSYLQASIRSSPGSEDKGDMRSLILFVFFDQDRYAGYMWFSSVPE
jgi:hypothetical protein